MSREPPIPARLPLSNSEIAQRLDEVADLLEGQQANPHRVRAYRTAAETVRGFDESVATRLQREGRGGLTQFPGIGESLARSIERLALTGRLTLLSQLRGDTSVERIFSTVAGIGPMMAGRLHDELGIETLAELQAAAYDGRLARVPGIGSKRLRAVQESLAGRFHREPRIPTETPHPKSVDDPSVEELLSIDEEYRQKARTDHLQRIAPRRFNPTGAAWLPILHTHRDGRHYTAMFSNTLRAHEMGTAHDWVVIIRDDQAGEGRWTVITSQFGGLKGHRIVRGREHECSDYYQRQRSGRTTQARSKNLFRDTVG
jgi:hypothetical protein